MAVRLMTMKNLTKMWKKDKGLLQGGKAYCGGSIPAKFKILQSKTLKSYRL